MTLNPSNTAKRLVWKHKFSHEWDRLNFEKHDLLKLPNQSQLITNSTKKNHNHFPIHIIVFAMENSFATIYLLWTFFVMMTLWTEKNQGRRLVYASLCQICMLGKSTYSSWYKKIINGLLNKANNYSIEELKMRRTMKFHWIGFGVFLLWVIIHHVLGCFCGHALID